jgi:hypothetical protein
MIHSFKEFRCKYEGKDICFLSELVSVVADSIMEPKFGMIVDETSFSDPKGKEEKGDQGKWKSWCHRCQ